jgi:hypothetical protein
MPTRISLLAATASGPLADRAGEDERRVDRAAVVDDGVEEADRDRRLGVEQLPGESEAHRPARADPGRQPEQRPTRGDQRAAHLGDADLGRAGRLGDDLLQACAPRRRPPSSISVRTAAGARR